MKALIVIDLQNDFLPGGSLAVGEGDHIIPLINRVMPYFDEVIATQDWHPEGHVSFHTTHGKPVFSVIKLNGSRQILWPVHAVQNTHGAELSSQLETSKITKYVKKGLHLEVDSYSAFYDNQRKRKTELEAYLKGKGVDTLYFAGLALDVCVLYSCLDALELGFQVYLIEDACRGVHTEDSKAAVEKIKRLGGKVVKVEDMLREFSR